MSFFADIESAKISGDSLYIRPGSYELKLEATKTGSSPRTGVQFCALEFEVVAAEPGSEHKVGDRPTHMIMANSKSWKGDVKAAIAAICGVTPDKVTTQAAEVFFGPKQPATGKTVRTRVWNKPTQSGKVFTKVAYHNPVVHGSSK